MYRDHHIYQQSQQSISGRKNDSSAVYSRVVARFQRECVCVCVLLVRSFTYFICVCLRQSLLYFYSLGIYSLPNSCFLNLFFCWCSVTGATNRKFLLFPLQKPTEFTYHSNIDVFVVCFNFQFICLEDFCITIRAPFLCRTQRNLAFYLCLCFFIFLCGSLINYLI